MDDTTRQSIVAATLVTTILAAVVAESLFLIRRRSVAPARAAMYVLLTDFLGLIVSFAVVVLFMLLLLMLIFGPDGLGTTGYEALMWVVVILGILFPPVIFVLIKRGFLYVFSILNGPAAWAYSVASSILFLVATPLPAVFVHYLIGYTR